VISEAVPANKFIYNGKPLAAVSLKEPKMLDLSKGEQESEHIVGIDWISAVTRDKAVKAPKSQYFTSQHVVASMENQKKTVEMLETAFHLNFEKLLLPT